MISLIAAFDDERGRSAKPERRGVRTDHGRTAESLSINTLNMPWAETLREAPSISASWKSGPTSIGLGEEIVINLSTEFLARVAGVDRRGLTTCHAVQGTLADSILTTLLWRPDDYQAATRAPLSSWFCAVSLDKGVRSR